MAQAVSDGPRTDAVSDARAAHLAELEAALARAVSNEARLEAENAQWKLDCEAIQSGNLMRMSAAAMAQRKALAAKTKARREERLKTETIPDQKTTEAFEREIKSLKTRTPY